MDPVRRIREDRQSARQLGDTSADICFLALSDESGPSVRTLVLRDITDNGISLFVNKTSPKWRAIVEQEKSQVLIWFPSLQRQYRISGRLREIERAVIEKNWYRRPTGSKYMDHTYEALGAQSSVIDSRETLVEFINSLKKKHTEEHLEVPTNATGIILEAHQVECLDLNNQDRIHDRRLYTWRDEQWTEEILIP